MAVGHMRVETTSFCLSTLILRTLPEEFMEGRRRGKEEGREDNESGMLLGTRNTCSHSWSRGGNSREAGEGHASQVSTGLREGRVSRQASLPLAMSLPLL